VAWKKEEGTLMFRGSWAKAAGLIAVAVGLTLGVGVTPAHASASVQICAQHGTGYCLNDWGDGGSGNPVKMYDNDYTQNNNFELDLIDACDGNDYITSACESGWGSEGSYLAEIQAVTFEIQYVNDPFYCVGTNTSTGEAILVACGTITGSGAGYGAIMAGVDVSGVCSPAYNLGEEATDRYWDSNEDALYFLQSGGAIGAQALFTNTSNPSCWGEN
jgi:hypothetical protein